MVALVLSALFVALVLLFFPFRYRIEFDPDEGINAMKAMLVLRGYSLYREVWSDQPPFFTYLLAAWLRIFGAQLTAGRILVLAMSAGLIALVAGYVRRHWGLLAAVLAVSATILLPFYLRLSVSMMIGLPAIALAFGSFSMLAAWHRHPSTGRIFLSAFLLGLSILTKGMSIILVPVWLVGIVFRIRQASTRAGPGSVGWKDAAVWLGTLAVLGAVAVGALIGPSYLGQLFDVHLDATVTDAFRSQDFHTLESFLVESWPIFFLAGIATWWAARRREPTAFYLSGWVVTGYVALTANQPTWYHHQLFVTIPAAVLAGIASAESIGTLQEISRRRPGTLVLGLSFVSLALALAFVAFRLPRTLDGLDLRLPNVRNEATDEDQERQLLALIYRHRQDTHWMFTDRPIFAFIAGIPVPPNLAVISQKRLLTQNLGQDEILVALETYAPELILTGRFDLPAVREYMRTRNFRRIDETPKYRLYFRPP